MESTMNEASERQWATLCHLIALVIADFVLLIVAAIQVSRGEHYRYPLCLRLIR